VRKSIFSLFILLQLGSTGFGQILPDSLDAFVTLNLKKYQVPGVVVSIVLDDSIVYLKGFGMQDLENEIPMDPVRTVFRVASVSKLFTATALLQQMERGVIGLHDDLSKYLEELGKSKRFEEPITLHHLLTHTSGFDNSDIGDATWDTDKILSCSEFLTSHSLHQAYPREKYGGTPITIWYWRVMSSNDSQGRILLRT